MRKYQVPTLTSTTTQDDQTKLVTALKAVVGVENVTLHLGSSELEIKAKDVKKQPTRETISAAASAAGFVISAKK